VPDESSASYYPRYPDESLADWHNRLGLTQK